MQKSKTTQSVHFTTLPGSQTEFYEIRHTRWSRWLIHACQLFSS